MMTGRFLVAIGAILCGAVCLSGVSRAQAQGATYHASHVFWTHLSGTEIVFGGTVPDAAKWPNVAAICAANPLKYTDYPANYP